MVPAMKVTSLVWWAVGQRTTPIGTTWIPEGGDLLSDVSPPRKGSLPEGSSFPPLIRDYTPGGQWVRGPPPLEEGTSIREAQ